MRYYYFNMKLLFCIFACCIITTCAYSQESMDTASVRVQYRAIYKQTDEQKETYDDTNLLDIGKRSSRFYSQRFELFLHQRDSVRNSTSDPMNYLQFLGDFLAPRRGENMKFISIFQIRGRLLIRTVCTMIFSFVTKRLFQLFHGNWLKAIRSL